MEACPQSRRGEGENAGCQRHYAELASAPPLGVEEETEDKRTDDGKGHEEPVGTHPVERGHTAHRVRYRQEVPGEEDARDSEQRKEDAPAAPRPPRDVRPIEKQCGCDREEGEQPCGGLRLV